MRNFLRLHQALDTCPFHRSKSRLVAEYLARATDEDAAWAMFLLFGGQLKPPVPTLLLQCWLLEEIPFPQWLFDLSKEQVGELTETVSLLAELTGNDFEERVFSEEDLSDWLRKKLLPFLQQPPALQRATLLEEWKKRPLGEISLFHALVTGRYATPVARRALEEAMAMSRGLHP